MNRALVVWLSTGPISPSLGEARFLRTRSISVVASGVPQAEDIHDITGRHPWFLLPPSQTPALFRRPHSVRETDPAPIPGRGHGWTE